MSKLCKSCGEYYEGEFCDKCGYGNPNIKTKSADKYKKYRKPERFRSEEDKAYYKSIDDEQAKSAPRRAPKAGIKTLAIVIVIAVGLLIFALVRAGVIFSESRDKVVEKYFSAIQSENFEDFISCFPSEIKADYENDLKQSGLAKDKYLGELYKDFEDMYGKGYKIEVKFGNEKELEKSEYSMSEYKKQYGSAPSISQAYEMAVTVKFSGSKKKEEFPMYICVGKCSGKWKILSTEGGEQ